MQFKGSFKSNRVSEIAAPASPGGGGTVATSAASSAASASALPKTPSDHRILIIVIRLRRWAVEVQALLVQEHHLASARASSSLALSGLAAVAALLLRFTKRLQHTSWKARAACLLQTSRLQHVLQHCVLLGVVVRQSHPLQVPIRRQCDLHPALRRIWQLSMLQPQLPMGLVDLELINAIPVPVRWGPQLAGTLPEIGVSAARRPDHSKCLPANPDSDNRLMLVAKVRISIRAMRLALADPFFSTAIELKRFRGSSCSNNCLRAFTFKHPKL